MSIAGVVMCGVVVSLVIAAIVWVFGANVHPSDVWDREHY